MEDNNNDLTVTKLAAIMSTFAEKIDAEINALAKEPPGTLEGAIGRALAAGARVSDLILMLPSETPNEIAIATPFGDLVVRMLPFVREPMLVNLSKTSLGDFLAARPPLAPRFPLVSYFSAGSFVGPVGS